MTRKNTKGKPSEKWSEQADKKDLKDICKNEKQPNGNKP